MYAISLLMQTSAFCFVHWICWSSNTTCL